MFEILKEFDEETVTKDNSIMLTREHNASLLSGNVDYSYEMNNSLMIEGDVIKTNKSIRKLKGDYLFL